MAFWNSSWQGFKVQLWEMAKFQIANICWIIEKQENSRKTTSTSASLIMVKPLVVWITTNYGKFLKRWEPVSWEACMQVKKQQLEPRHGTTDWLKTGKGVHPGCILSYLMSMQSTSCSRLDDSQARIRNIQKTKIMASGPITSWQIDGETMQIVRLYFLGLQNHCRWWLQPWN